MDDYPQEEFDDGDALDMEEGDALDMDEGVVEQTEQQRDEAADLVKLLKQHPEIWIPYEEQIRAQLTTSPPGTAETSAESTDALRFMNLRNLSLLDAVHTTYPFLTNYERTKCISFRASQLSNGAKPYMLVPEGVSDSAEIATMELEAKRLPYILKRPLPDGTFEVWRLTDLVVF